MDLEFGTKDARKSARNLIRRIRKQKEELNGFEGKIMKARLRFGNGYIKRKKGVRFNR